MHGRRCQPATTPIVDASPMMRQCAAISPISHQGTWAAACRAAGCRADRGMACVPRLTLSPRKRKEKKKRRSGRRAGASTHATAAPRIFIRGKGEAVLIKIEQDVNTGAQRYTVRYVAPPQETAVIDYSQIRRLKWGMHGRLRLRPFPRIMGEEPCSYYGRRLLYDHSHSSEEVQRCMARLCAREDADNAFCEYGEMQGKSEPPGGVDAMVRGIGRILAKFCAESPDALESEICQVYQNLTQACKEGANQTIFEPKDRCTNAARRKSKVKKNKAARPALDVGQEEGDMGLSKMFEDKDEESVQDPQAATAEKEGAAPAEEGALREEASLEKRAREDAERERELRQEADKSRDEASAAAQMSSQDCSQLNEETCVRKGCKWYKSDSLLSMAARKTGVGSMIGRGKPRCMSKNEYQNMLWTKGSATDATQVAEQKATAWADAKRRAESSKRELVVAQSECSLDTEQACTEQKHCGWFDSECHTREDLLDHANTWNETVGARKDACKAARAVWTPTKWGWGGKCAWDRGKPS